MSNAHEIKMKDEALKIFKVEQSVSVETAKNLSISTNTIPLMTSLSPRWLLRLLQWVDVSTGIYRINQVQFLSDTKALSISKLAPYISLKALPLFRGLDDSILAEIEANLSIKAVKANEVIVKEGDLDSDLYIILEGEYAVNVKNRNNEEITVKVLSEGNFFGEMAPLMSTPRQATVIAKTKGRLICIKKDVFDKAVADPLLRKKLKEAYEARKKELTMINQYGEAQAPLIAGNISEVEVPKGFVDYKYTPIQIELSVIQTIVGINTKIDEIYNVPYNQLEQQLRITIENIREREEWELINNKGFGFLHNVDSDMVISTRNGTPTPDDLDNLLALVWKRPTFFLAHPRAIAAFGRECTYRGVPPPVVELFGASFLTWRGLPLIPSDKLMIDYQANVQSTNIILMRVGEENQGVVGLHKASIGANKIPSLSVKFMGIDEHSVANYQLTKYFSAAILVPDALAVLKNVAVDAYHEYK